jgi:hypothetical protein
MCFKHYWRVQRHGDPNVVLKPGRPPGPESSSTSATEVSRLHHELAGLREENAALRQQRAPQQPPAEAAKLTRQIAQLTAALKTANSGIQQLNQRIQNLDAELDFWRSISTEPMSIGPANGTITEQQRRTLLAAFHSDRATDPKQKRRLDEAFKIVNSLTVIKSSRIVR